MAHRGLFSLGLLVVWTLFEVGTVVQVQALGAVDEVGSLAEEGFNIDPDRNEETSEPTIGLFDEQIFSTDGISDDQGLSDLADANDRSEEEDDWLVSTEDAFEQQGEIRENTSSTFDNEEASIETNTTDAIDDNWLGSTMEEFETLEETGEETPTTDKRESTEALADFEKIQAQSIEASANETFEKNLEQTLAEEESMIDQGGLEKTSGSNTDEFDYPTDGISDHQEPLGASDPATTATPPAVQQTTIPLSDNQQDAKARVIKLLAKLKQKRRMFVTTSTTNLPLSTIPGYKFPEDKYQARRNNIENINEESSRLLEAQRRRPVTTVPPAPSADATTISWEERRASLVAGLKRKRLSSLYRKAPDERQRGAYRVPRKQGRNRTTKRGNNLFAYVRK